MAETALDLRFGFVSVEELLDLVRARPLSDGRCIPVCLWGGRGIGKCVSAETRILTDMGEVPIDALWQSHAGPIEQHDDDGGEWATLTAPIQVRSLATPLDGGAAPALAWRPVARLYRQRVHEWGRAVRLADGREIVMTAQHRLLTPRGFSRDLRAGEHVCCADGDGVRRVRVVATRPVALDAWVYDLEVPGSHTYVAAGIVTHNTQLIRHYARERELDVITYHPAHDDSGADIVGHSYIDPDTRRTVYALPDWLPTESGRGGVLFIDEINRAERDVLQGLMEVLGEGQISQSGWELPEGWNIVCAANPPGAQYHVNEMDEAMMDRLLHYNFTWNAPAWVRWAEDEGINHKVIDFALQNPDIVEGGDPELPLNVNPVATPRSLQYFGALYDEGMEPRMLRLITIGLLGREAANVMIDHHRDPERALTGSAILAGGVDAVVADWLEDQRDDLLLASTGRLVAVLQTRDPEGYNLAAQRAAYWLSLLAGRPDLFRAAVRLMAESVPKWLAVIFEVDEYGLAASLPRNEAQLRTAPLRQLAAQRQTRAQMRRLAEEGIEVDEFDAADLDEDDL